MQVAHVVRWLDGIASGLGCVSLVADQRLEAMHLLGVSCLGDFVIYRIHIIVTVYINIGGLRDLEGLGKEVIIDVGDAGDILVNLNGIDNILLDGFHKLNCPYLVQVSDQLFRQLMDRASTNQVSLTIENYAYTGRVLKAAQDMGYLAVSPYQLGSTMQISELVTERLQTLMICAAVLLAVLILQILVLRALFGSELENYRLLANIGLTCATAQRSILWQVLLFTALGQGVGFERIRRITGYLVGTMDKWNDAKRAEERDRVKHGLSKDA